MLTDESISNQSHPSASLTLSIMMAALPLFNDYRKFGPTIAKKLCKVLTFLVDLRKKSLSAFCRMVIKPDDYSENFEDKDLISLNSTRTKKNKINAMPDVTYARALATCLQQELGLSYEACHSLGEDISYDDFIFSSGDWLDPGPEIDCIQVARDVPLPYQ